MYQEKTNVNYLSNINSSTIEQQKEEDEDYCVWDEDDTKEEFKDNRLAIARKFLSKKPMHKSFISTSIANSWCDHSRIKIKELDYGFFHISMEKQGDIKMILKGNPWIFRNVWFLVKPWNQDYLDQQAQFFQVLVTIQFSSFRQPFYLICIRL